MSPLTKLQRLIMSSRPISWPNTAFPFGAAYLVAVGHVDATFIIGSLYFLIPYNLMMYGINDVFDYESDIRNPRKGGIEGVKLDRSIHRLTIVSSVLVSVPFLAFLLFHGSLVANAVLCYVVFMVLAYSLPVLRFKERPIIDSITSSTHFVGPMVYAMVLTGWQPSYWPYVLAFFTWGMASHAFGAVQDIIADREAGIGSVATIFGARATVWLAGALYIVAGLFLINTNMAGRIAGGLSLLYAINVLRFAGLTDSTAETANRGWRVFLWLNWLSGFVITLLLIAHFRHFG